MPKSLPPHERLNELLRYEDGRLYWRVRRGNSAAGAEAGRINNGRLQVRVDGVEYFVHRIVWAMHRGHDPHHTIDHINGDPLDNRIENLRDVPLAINCHNRRSPSRANKTGYLGVYVCRGRHVAQITVAGRTRRIGSYDSAREAHEAYVRVKRELHPGNLL